MAGDYSFGSAMGGDDDPQSSSLSSLLTYGADPAEETPGQPNSAPNVKSDASAPNASAEHVSSAAAVVPVKPPTQASQAPIYNPPDTTALTAAQGRLQQDEQTSNVKPKWWERTLGGLTAGAMAFGHMPGAVEAGQAVTNRGQNAAEDQRAGRVRADQAAIQAWQDGQKQKQKDFDNQTEAYRTKQTGVRSDLEATGQQQQQSNADRTFNRETANDTFNQNRENKNDDWEHTYQKTGQTETARHNKADETLRSREVGIAGSREARESKKQVADDKLSAPEVRQQQLANQTQDKYRTQVQQLETGDPKGATPEDVQGFKQHYRQVSNSLVNPDTGNPWGSSTKAPAKSQADADKAKADYLDDMKQANADRKNSAMQAFAEDMNRLGVDTPVVTYDKEGKASTSSATPAQGGATPAQSSPAAATTSPAATAKVKAGTVKVGDPVTDGKRTGTVTGIAPNGKPQVKWN